MIWPTLVCVGGGGRLVSKLHYYIYAKLDMQLSYWMCSLHLGAYNFHLGVCISFEYTYFIQVYIEYTI